MSGRASLISRFILRITPMCSSLLSSEYRSSLAAPMRAVLCEALYVSRLALDRTTMSRLVSLSLGAIGTCCSATSCGRAGGGSDWVPGEGAESGQQSEDGKEEACARW